MIVDAEKNGDFRVARVESQLAALEGLEDERARETGLAAVQGVLELYGEALRRLLKQVDEVCGPDVVRRIADDELIGHVLLVHDLHPIELETRVRRALDEVRPYLDSHGGNVELLSIDGGVARLRLIGSCRGCPSSTATLRDSIEHAIWKAAPELEEILAEDETSRVEAAPPALVQLGAVGRAGGMPA